MSNVLVVVAHPDDEVLGAGGVILRHKDIGDTVSVLILSDGETSRDNGVDIKKRNEQALQAANVLGVDNSFFAAFPDNSFDTVALLDIAKKIEEVIRQINPSIIYTHHANDLNIDHRRTCEAVLTAARPQPGYPVRAIYSFEVLSSTEWQIKSSEKLFAPTLYVDIKKYINKKKEALSIYKDELQPSPHPRSLEGVDVLATWRGMEVGLEYAEAFVLIREIKI
jgi:N-acetylglucosamine malate deacetylase 1